MARGDLAEITGSDRQSARERAFRLLAGAVTALVATFAVLAAVFIGYDNSVQWVTHTHAVRTGIADVLQGVSDAESAQRAYMITNNERYVGVQQEGRAYALRRLSDLRVLTADNRPQLRRVTALSQLVDQRLAIMDQVIATRRMSDVDAAVSVGRRHGAGGINIQIRRILSEIDQAEAQLEAERERRASALRLLLVVTSVTFGLLLIALFVKAVRDLALDREVEAETSDRLRELVRQRTLLLDEVNHRVKNSLQQIAGVMRLQARASNNPEVREELEKTLARIIAVGRVHEQVYKAEGRLGVFDAGSYADHLARDLVQSMGREDIRLEIDTESALLDLSHASPIALILNELITNALKYGCPPEAPGCALRVAFASEGESYVLSVADEGPGLAPDAQPVSANTLGLRAVDALSRQLGGRLEVERPERGATFRVRFPKVAA
jgi:two-component sensor histidine kinase